MSNTLGALMERNLLEVFGQQIPRAARSAIAEIYAADCTFFEAEERIVGRDTLNAKVERLLQEAPGFRVSAAGPAQVNHDLGRLPWHFGPAGAPPVVTGMDVAVFEHGKSGPCTPSLINLRATEGGSLPDEYIPVAYFAHVCSKKDLDNTMDELSAPNPVFEIVLGTLMMIVIMFVHGVGLRTINQRFSKSWIHVNGTTPHWRINLLLAFTIGSLAALHFAETLLWAAPVSLMGLIPSMRDSYYFVLESYTTLGEGTVSLPDRWRLIGPIIAMSGLFTFGWTGSVLVSIMTEFGKLDRVRAKKEPMDRGAL